MSSYGCEHYQRKAKLLTPCCRKDYICHRCHDNKEKHQLKRSDVTTIVCLECNYPQAVSQFCCRCRSKLGEYFCKQCRLYDDCAKGQFHCDKCGICRIGGRYNYFHCDECNMCFHINIRTTHKCIKNSGTDGCTVCLEDIHTSTTQIMVPICGHLIHQTCFESLQNVGIASCPTCRVNMKSIM